MLPSNVMSFMKKMVEQPQQSQPQQSANENSGTTFGKLKQTLSSSLLTAQDKGKTLTHIAFWKVMQRFKEKFSRKALRNLWASWNLNGNLFSSAVNKMSPRPSLIPDMQQDMQQFQPHIPENIEKDSDPTTNQNLEKNEPNKTANRASSCRVCLKSFKQVRKSAIIKMFISNE